MTTISRCKFFLINMEWTFLYWKHSHLNPTNGFLFEVYEIITLFEVLVNIFTDYVVIVLNRCTSEQ